MNKFNIWQNLFANVKKKQYLCIGYQAAGQVTGQTAEREFKLINDMNKQQRYE